MLPDVVCATRTHIFAECTVPLLASAFARLFDATDPPLHNSADAREVNLAFVSMVKHFAQIDAAANRGGDVENVSRMESGRLMTASIVDKYPWKKKKSHNLTDLA
jgi:hypothetical protein